MKKLSFLVIFLLLFFTSYISARTYSTASIYNFTTTNKNSFIVSHASSNELNDLYTCMRISKAIGEVATNGITQTIINTNSKFSFKISREKFIKPNPLQLFDNYMDNLNLIIVEPINNQTNRPCVFVTCGGTNMTSSHSAFYLGIAQYAMKGYVVAYYENPNSAGNQDNQALYFANTLPGGECILNKIKPCSDEISKKAYASSMYLGVQTGEAVANYMATNKVKYKIDNHKFISTGQSYGGFVALSLGLGSKYNYYDVNTNKLKIPFIYFKAPNMYSKSISDYTFTSVAAWAGNYPLVDNDPTHFNPFGEFIDNIQSHIVGNNTIEKKDAKVISFHGYIDDEINVYEGWLNGIANKTMYSHGPINVVNRFSNAGVKFNGYINCEGKHPVKDLIFYSKNPQDVESRYNNLINTFNYITLTSSDPLFAIKMKELKYEMEQTMDIIDISTSFFMNNTSPSNSTYYIEPKIKNVNGHYNFKSSCESSPFEVNASKSEIVDNIKIFPSPANLDWIEIDILDWEQYKKGYLYNIEGQLIKEINLESDRNIIDISDINNGIYIFKFEKNKLPIFRKIVIQK